MNDEITNKKLGNDFEAEFCEMLFDKGFWVHLLNQNKSGQPADVIAVRGQFAYLIDCKVCSSSRFALSRVEENQDMSMTLWETCGNGEGWFALLMGHEVYMIPHYIMIAYRDKSILNEEDIKRHGVKFERWVNTECR